jgi:ferrous iron transport protein B
MISDRPEETEPPEVDDGQQRRGEQREIHVAVVGSPNSGKTTLFNALTGMHQKVGNYPGVTVEGKEGSYRHRGTSYRLLDLPGAYSLTATSDDERIVRNLLLGLVPVEPHEDLALVVVAATHLERQLYIAAQVMDLGVPMVIALTMNDEARRLGREVDVVHLSERLSVPVVEVSVSRGQGVDNLRSVLRETVGRVPVPPLWSIGDNVLKAVDQLAAHLEQYHPAPLSYRRQLAVQVLLYPEYEHPLRNLPGVDELLSEQWAALESTGEHWRQAEAQGRFNWIKEVVKDARAAACESYVPSRSDRIDRVVTHPVWGLIIFAVVMAAAFQSVFLWAVPFMEGIDWLFGWLGGLLSALIGVEWLKGLVVDGVIAGIGGVMVFLPQILFLFFFIAVLEDSGYMARAAFLMNRHMRRAGLHGRAFIPLMAGFACSIPGIMAARTIPNRRDKLVTMLVVPLISCSARLPVYALMIAAFIPALPVVTGVSVFTWQGLALWLIYLWSIAIAITMAFLLRKTVLPGQAQPFVMELPPYRMPHWRTVLMAMWNRGMQFVTTAGTIILIINVILWFLLSYPVNPQISTRYQQERDATHAAYYRQDGDLAARLADIDTRETSTALAYSFAGRLGKGIEPVIEPLGFDWRIGISIIGSLAAREVFVSTFAVILGVSDSGDGEGASLVERIRGEISPLSGISIIIFFLLSCQCIATVAVMKRESKSWGWAAFLYVYMTSLAYIACLVFFQVASRIWPTWA